MIDFFDYPFEMCHHFSFCRTYDGDLANLTVVLVYCSFSECLLYGYGDLYAFCQSRFGTFR